MLRSLQAGRAVAAIVVAAFHLSITMGLARYGGVPVFRNFTQYGDIGVDFFFVLSGFIILHAHANDIGNPSAWKRYAYRRFIRIFPIYWLYTAVFVAMLAFGAGTDATMPSGFANWLTSISLIRFTAAAPPLPVAWTLFHELAFYFLFLVCIVNRWVGRGLFALLAIMWISFFQFPSSDERTAFNVYLSVINLEFVMGMGSYWLFKHFRYAAVKIIAGAGIFAAAAILVRSHEGIGVRLLFALSFALLTAGVARLEQEGKIRVPVAIGFVGDASYSLYLIHLAFEGACLKAFSKLGLREFLAPEIIYCLALLVTIGVGCLAYKIVEVPLMNLFKKTKARITDRRIAV